MQTPHDTPPDEAEEPKLTALVAAAAAAWVQALGQDGGLSTIAKEAVRATARLVLAALERAPALAPETHVRIPPQSPEPATSVPVVTLIAAPEAEPVAISAMAEPAATLEAVQALASKFSGSMVSPRLTDSAPALPAPQYASSSGPSLSILARRVDLSARACDWAIRRHDNQVNGEDFEVIRPEYNAIRDEARAMQPLYLWMIDRETSRISRDDWVMLVGCYRNMATAAELVSGFADGREADIDFVKLLTESQSSVFSALSMVDAPRDGVQQSIFEWCRDEAARRGEYIPHLSRAEQTNPALWGGLGARIDAAREQSDAERHKIRALRKHLNTVRYHIGQIRDDDDDDHANDWKRIDDGIREFLDAGGKPSDPKLVDLILPVAELLPEEYAMREATYRRVLPFVDQRLASDLRPQQESASDRAPCPELAEARALLRGKVVVLVGGEPRSPQREALERELELKELRWLSSREHESTSSFIPDIRRRETALVLLAIRWASHSYEELQATCIQFDKPFVRLPGGYGANRVAYEVVRQQGDRLRASGE